MELQGEIDKSIVTVGDFNSSFLVMIEPTKRKSVLIQLNKTAPPVHWIQLTYIEYYIQQQSNTHFSSSHGIFSMIDHMLCQKSEKNCKGTGIIQNTFSFHNGTKPKLITERLLEKLQCLEIKQYTSE